MPILPYRGLASCALSAAILLIAGSCRPENATRKSVLPAPPGAAFEASSGQFLEGRATAGVAHVVAVLKALQRPDRGNGRVKFEFSEAEINEYLAYSLRLKPRAGIRELAVRLNPDDAFSVRTVMDFESILKWHSWILPDALKAIASADPAVEMDVKFSAHDGYGSYKLLAVRGLGGALTADAAMWVIQAISLQQPESYDTLRPIPLPFGLRRIWTGQGSVSGDTASDAARQGRSREP
jgi:hypothetical protein